MFSTKTGAAKLSLIAVTGLILLKVAVGIVTGSISIIAQAVDSLLDLFAVVLTFLSVRIATKPADRKHPFGHGKVENISGAIQAGLILIAGGLVIYTAIFRIVEGAEVRLTEAGIGVMLVSIIVSILLSRYLLKVSRATDSIALEANARNIAADVYSASGVLVGLAVIRFTGLNILDPIIALGVAVLIFKAAYEVARKSFGGLVDVSLPPSEEAKIESSIMEHYGELIGFHELRTRKAGDHRYIDLHLTMPKSISLEEAHEMCDHLEKDIEARLTRATITIHVEPCETECEDCTNPCPRRRS